MKDRFIKIGIFILGLFLIVNLSRSLIDMWQKGGLLEKEEERFAKVRLENEELNKEFTKLQTPEYIEKQAREKLGLSKEGEAVVVLPPKAGETPSLEDKTPTKTFDKPVWQQWINLLAN